MGPLFAKGQRGSFFLVPFLVKWNFWTQIGVIFAIR